jgi:hypothetical protein
MLLEVGSNRLLDAPSLSDAPLDSGRRRLFRAIRKARAAR